MLLRLRKWASLHRVLREFGQAVRIPVIILLILCVLSITSLGVTIWWAKTVTATAATQLEVVTRLPKRGPGNMLHLGQRRGGAPAAAKVIA